MSFSFGLTLNTGNYTAVRVDESYQTDLAVGEDVDDAMDRAARAVVPDVFTKAQALAKKLKAELPPPEERRWKTGQPVNRFKP